MTEHELRHLRRRVLERGIEVVVARDRIIDPDHRERRAVHLGDRRLVLQHLVAVVLERRGDPGAPREVIVIAEHREDALGAQASELLAHELSLAAAPAYVISREHDDVWLGFIRRADRGPHVRCRRHVADMNVG
jgi:hypothetical protein